MHGVDHERVDVGPLQLAVRVWEAMRVQDSSMQNRFYYAGFDYAEWKQVSGHFRERVSVSMGLGLGLGLGTGFTRSKVLGFNEENADYQTKLISCLSNYDTHQLSWMLSLSLSKVKL